MAKIQMEVIPKPDFGAVIASEPRYIANEPYATGVGGYGDTNYVCGACRAVILWKVERGQFIGLVFQCSSCGSYNKVYGT